MDAKSRADFINSVAGNQKIPCPNCNTLNDIDSSFCFTCGTQIRQTAAPVLPQEIICPCCGEANAPEACFCMGCGKLLNQVPVTSSESDTPDMPSVPAKNESPFVPVRKKPSAMPAHVREAAPPVSQADGEVSVFAEGLPGWDIVPPQVMVRRKKR